MTAHASSRYGAQGRSIITEGLTAEVRRGRRDGCRDELTTALALCDDAHAPALPDGRGRPRAARGAGRAALRPAAPVVAGSFQRVDRTRKAGQTGSAISPFDGGLLLPARRAAPRPPL